MVRAMDANATLAIAAAINHELPSLVQELRLERERKAMQLEDLAVQGMTGMFVANLDMIHSRVDYLGCSARFLARSRRYVRGGGR